MRLLKSAIALAIVSVCTCLTALPTDAKTPTRDFIAPFCTNMKDCYSETLKWRQRTGEAGVALREGEFTDIVAPRGVLRITVPRGGSLSCLVEHYGHFPTSRKCEPLARELARRAAPTVSAALPPARAATPPHASVPSAETAPPATLPSQASAREDGAAAAHEAQRKGMEVLTGSVMLLRASFDDVRRVLLALKTSYEQCKAVDEAARNIQTSNNLLLATIGVSSFGLLIVTCLGMIELGKWLHTQWMQRKARAALRQ